MTKRIKKKQIRRLFEAMGHYFRRQSVNDDWTVEACEEYTPPRKPLTGKSARRLIGAHYRTLDAYENGWLHLDRPKFRKDRKYAILAEQCEGDRRETLRIVRA